jgi:hypothetical protein
MVEFVARVHAQMFRRNGAALQHQEFSSCRVITRGEEFGIFPLSGAEEQGKTASFPPYAS